MRLGILGGTFDPIHHAHLFIGEEARVRFGLDRVLFVPNRTPPHKCEPDLTPEAHRFAMVELAVASNPRFSASRVELDRPGPSYTVDTLRILKEEYPAAEFYFISGLDAVAEMGSWKEPLAIAKLSTIVAIGRPGFDAENALAALPPDLRLRIEVIASPLMAISSTLLRERVQAGLPIRYLTPDPVIEYIQLHGLYRPK
ncbi:MAG: nicotinate-nucleotide adenylyltransferase [Chthonomonadales bacterium]